MPKIIHYRNNCIGCGICQEQQPEFWRMSKKDGKAVLLQATNKKDIYQLTIHANQQTTSVQIAAACPVKIIKVV
jgi:ferredoxin